MQTFLLFALKQPGRRLQQVMLHIFSRYHTVSKQILSYLFEKKRHVKNQIDDELQYMVIKKQMFRFIL